jgi:hypothetical protein
MATIDICLNSICQQRKKSLLYTTPSIRFDIENIYEKYPEFTKFQFDMRRKAEILSYNPSSSSTQTNNLTKKEKFVQIMKGTTSDKNASYKDIILSQSDICGNYSTLVVKYPDSYTSRKVLYAEDACLNPLYRTEYTVIPNGRLIPVCNTDLIPQPTSSSGVPGPIMYLIKDITVPLYNYTKNNNAYGLINSQTIAPWNTFTSDNIQFYNSIINKLFTLSIQSTINEYAYNFNFSTPLYLFFKGSANIERSDINRTLRNKITIFNIGVDVKYNDETIELQKPIGITPTSHFSSTEFTIDLVTNSYILPFEGGIYLGMLNITNMYLYTQPGYIYDINLRLTLSFTSLDGFYSSYFKQIISGIYCNTTTTNKLQNNCIINTVTSIEPNIGFTFSGN